MPLSTVIAPLTAPIFARQLAAYLPHVAAASGVDLLSPYFRDDAGDLTEIIDMETTARFHAEIFGDSDGKLFYFHLIEALGLISVPTFHPMEGRDGPWLVGDGIGLWSAPNQLTARMVAAAIDAAGMNPYVECFISDDKLAAAEAAEAVDDDASDDANADAGSSVLASFRLPFIGGTVAVAHSRAKSDQFVAGLPGTICAMAAGIIAGLSLCAMVKTAQFNHCAGPNGDPARIVHCAGWLR